MLTFVDKATREALLLARIRADRGPVNPFADPLVIAKLNSLVKQNHGSSRTEHCSG